MLSHNVETYNFINTIYSINNPFYLNNPKLAYGENYQTLITKGQNISKKLLQDAFDFINSNELPQILYFTIGSGCKESKYNSIIQQFPIFLEHCLNIDNFSIGIVVIDVNIKNYIFEYIQSTYMNTIKTIELEYNIQEELSEFDLEYLKHKYLHYNIKFNNGCNLRIALIPDWLYINSQYHILNDELLKRNQKNLISLIANFGVHYNNTNKSLLYSQNNYEIYDFRKILTLKEIKNHNVFLLEWGLNYYCNKKNFDKKTLSNYLIRKINTKITANVITTNEILISLNQLCSFGNQIIKLYSS